MADFKMVWNYISPGSTGGQWSEVTYKQAGSLSEAATFTKGVASARMEFLNKLNTLVKVRVSQVGNPRVTTIVNFAWNGQGAGDGPAPIDSAVVLNLASTVLPARRKFWLRGWSIGDALRLATNGSDWFNPIFVQNVMAWIKAMAGDSYEILARQKPATAGFGYSNLLTVDGSTKNGWSKLTLQTPLAAPPAGVTGLIVGQVNQKDAPKLDGVFTFYIDPTGGLWIPYQTPEGQVLTLTTGRVRYLGYITGAIIDPAASGISYLAGRKSKSPTTGSRGARHANRRLRSQL
jgi:hypothetical protein